MSSLAPVKKREGEELVFQSELESEAKRSKSVTLFQELFVNYTKESSEYYPFPNLVTFSALTLAKLGDPLYISIGRYVLQAGLLSSQNEDTITVFDHVKTSIIDKQPGEKSEKHILRIRAFIPTPQLCVKAKSITFKVYPWRDFDHIGKSDEPTVILHQAIESLIPSELGKQIVRTNQEFFLKHPVVGPLKIVVDKCKGANKNDTLESITYPEYVKFSKSTRFSFLSGNSKAITIVKKVDESIIKEVHLKITNVTETWQKGITSSLSAILEKDWFRVLQPLPLVLPIRDLIENILKKWKDTLIYPDKVLTLKTPERKYHIKFTFAESGLAASNILDGQNLVAFFLREHHSIKLDSGAQVILTGPEESAQPAEELLFQISALKKEYNPEPNQLIWFNVDEIRAQLFQKLKYLPKNSKCTVSIGGYVLLLELVSVAGNKLGDTQGAKQLWKVVPQTVINLFADPKLNVQLLHGNSSTAIEKMEIIVTRKSIYKSEESTRPLNQDAIVVDSFSIAEAFRNALCTDMLISPNMILHGITRKGQELSFRVRSAESKKEYSSNDQYQNLQFFNSLTKVTWLGDKQGDVIIKFPPEPKPVGNIQDLLIEAGLGGLSNEVLEAISNLKLFGSEYAGYLKDRGISPSRGIILWGPPGTGKTELARHIGQILGISPDRTQMCTGAGLWDKWLGESEKNIERLFAQAREEQNLLGEKSEKHLIIIDEMDACCQTRSGSKSRHETSVLGMFLSQLDGITKSGLGPLNNVLVIGMTNLLDVIDEAVKRPGRLGIHIQVGIPNLTGRIEIFEIHCQKLINMGSLARDVDFRMLAMKTEGRTGAEIKALVDKAAQYHVTRLYNAGIPRNEAEANHPLAKVTMADFETAIQEFKRTDSIDKPPPGLFL